MASAAPGHPAGHPAVACAPKVDVHWSELYEDDAFEYVHARLPKKLGTVMALAASRADSPATGWRELLGLLEETCPGWERYAVHAPEPHVLLLRRRKSSGKSCA